MFASKLIFAGAVVFLVSCAPALADRDPPLSGDQLKAYKMLLSLSVKERQLIFKKLAENSTARGSWVAKAATTSPPANLSTTSTKTLSKGCEGFIPLLRQDWNDIDFTSCPQDVAKATGAQIAITNDRVKDNVNWSMEGTAAVLYNAVWGDDTGIDGSYVTSTGAYVTFDRTTNSALKQMSNNIDTLAYGGVIQFGVRNGGDATPADPYIGNYFMLRGGAVQDDIKNTTAGAVTFEWTPVFDNGFIKIQEPFPVSPNIPLLIRLDPVALVQYADALRPGEILAFNDRSEALRIGPQLTLNFFPDWWADNFIPPIPLSHMHASVSYHWADEIFSGSGLDYLQTNVGYNLDADGNVALTGTYQRGHDENTGIWENVYKISLSGKI